jgi:hypothetical protein
LLFVLPLYGLLGTYFLQRNIDNAHGQYVLHRQVLQGEALGAYQYSMTVHDHVLDAMFRLAPRHTEMWFAACYTVYYAAGLTLFLLALFATCRRLTDDITSSIVCLYVVAIWPLFLYDQPYHPQDPWTAFIAILVVRTQFASRSRAPYFLLLLMGSFATEKLVFFPLSRAVADFLKRRKLSWIGVEFLLGTLLSVAGQLIFRFHYGVRPVGVGSLRYNLSYFHHYLFGLVVTQGIAIYYLLRGRSVRPEFWGLMVQTPAWLVLYLFLNGFIFEFRAIFLVAMAYSTPLMAMFVADAFGLTLPQRTVEAR